MNIDYQKDDRGGWIRNDEHNRTFRILSCQFKTDNSIKEIHSQSSNKDYLSLVLEATTAVQYFDQELLSKSTGPDVSDETNSENTQSAIEVATEEVSQEVTSLGWQSTWLGDYLPFSNGWIYHAKIYWMYIQPDSQDGVWGYIINYGWMWSNPRIYPYFYANSTKEWIYIN